MKECESNVYQDIYLKKTIWLPITFKKYHNLHAHGMHAIE